jgi:hypothetical protein
MVNVKDITLRHSQYACIDFVCLINVISSVLRNSVLGPVLFLDFSTIFLHV